MAAPAAAAAAAAPEFPERSPPLSDELLACCCWSVGGGSDFKGLRQGDKRLRITIKVVEKDGFKSRFKISLFLYRNRGARWGPHNS
jgi:hypothetical protein